MARWFLTSLFLFLIIWFQQIIFSPVALAQERVTLTTEQYEELKRSIREEVLEEIRQELREEKLKEEDVVKKEEDQKEDKSAEEAKAETEESESKGQKALDALNKAIGNLRVSVDATGVVQGTEGADMRVSPTGDVADASISFDLYIEAPIGPNGTAYTHLEAALGAGIDGHITTISGFNDDAMGNTALSLSELWYQHEFLNMFLLRVGQLDMTTDFDVNAVANDETTQFLSSGFVNSLAIDWPQDYSFGTMTFFKPTPWFQIGFGWADGDADYDNIFSDPFLITEATFSPKILGLQGNYRFNYWFNGTNHQDLRNPFVPNLNGWGFGFSFDQQVAHFITLFARYGYLRERVYQLSHAWSAGFEISGSWYGRSLDRFGIAYGMGIIGDNWERINFLAGTNSGNEGHLEFYYSIGINEHLSIAPDIQMVFNPGGIDASSTVWAFGTRAQLDF